MVTCLEIIHPAVSPGSIPLTLVDHSMYGVVQSNIPDNYPCSAIEIYHPLSTLDTRKATGLDSLSAHMLKATACGITPSLTVLINLSLQSGTVHTEWKKSLIVPIPKSSSVTTPNDYQPIFLLSILNKVLKQHVHILFQTISITCTLSQTLNGVLTREDHSDCTTSHS